jgi:hypothetical protein
MPYKMADEKRRRRRRRKKKKYKSGYAEKD